MKKEEFPQFATALNRLAAIFRVKLESETIQIYWDSMVQFPVEQFVAIARELERKSQFFPRPADFWNELRDAERQPLADVWGRVLGHLKSLNYAGAVHEKPIGDELIDRAAQSLGGWTALYFTPQAQLHFAEKRFSERYTELREVAEARKTVGMLVNSVAPTLMVTKA